MGDIVVGVDCILIVEIMSMAEVVLRVAPLTEGDVPSILSEVLLTAVGLSNAVEMITVVSSIGILVVVGLKEVIIFVVGVAIISLVDVNSAKRMVEVD